jgi:transposase-like protein
MSQHFLLTAEARSLSVREVFALSDEAAFGLFRELRWGKGEEVACPECGVVERHWFLPSRRQWRCKACAHTFSVTSGTIFAHHKLPLRVYLGAVALYTNAAKGLSALQMCRDLGVQYKTAFVLMHKLRESLIVQREETPLCGEVEMDGGYVGGHVRPQNKKEDRVDRRLAENRSPDKRCILVMRENHPKADEAPGPGGARRTLSFVIGRENQADIGALAQRFIAPETVISADESDAYDLLHGTFPMRRVNHQHEYRADDGTTNNQAESYFSRFRRMEIGQTHKFGLRYLANYANEAAYREDTRRLSNGEIFRDILTKCTRTQTHRDWCGYWQGNKRRDERLAA